MTPREIAERHCNVVEGDGCYCLSVCGTLEPFATKADAEKARAGCMDELTAVIAAACEEAAAEARRAALRPVEDLLVKNGCDCPCDCHLEWHDDDCDRCLACRIEAAIRARKEAE